MLLLANYSFAQKSIDTTSVLKAINEISKEIEDTLFDENSYYYRGMYYYGIGMYHEAKKDFEEFIQIGNIRGGIFISGEKLYNVLLYIGWIEGYFKESEKAIKYYQAASEIDSLQSKPYFQLGHVYMNRGDTLKACSFFNKAKKLDKDIEIPIDCK